MNSRVLPLLALFLAIGIFFVYISPMWSGTIATTKAAIKSNNEALAAAATYKARENELASAKNAMDPDNLARLSALLPDSVDNVRLILDLNALAARSGLTLSNIDVARTAADSVSVSDALPSTDASVVGAANLSLSAVGTYQALQTFLLGVEMSERLLDVKEIALSGSDTGVYTYKMTVRLYWLR
ncbi:hypothetical protein A3A36_00485 [Candidatus Kaiserbacteria bacterium RIFCSPLOWO2_01_FULL_52_12b]|uniref:Pilus assembly protein PilO n=1 Tax=Candidatus Kaiserbacteria bacterium RIFCSPLOWO2_01_FULL_52_12b TaxID=1798509 RepID=A0A1F6EY11_9BACT|nr:MAG: hypothetical protein A3A36_00485 [Candidatus Kaiserbacteria bacterium RIFCSPLOWO2_01_FULL_52_12b]